MFKYHLFSRFYVALATNVGSKIMPYFFLGIYNYIYKDTVTCIMGTSFTKFTLLFQKVSITNTTSLFSRETLYVFPWNSLLITPDRITHALSARRQQNSVLGAHPSCDLWDGSWRMINRDCSENEGVQASAGTAMTSVFRESEGIMSLEFSERCHSKLRVMCADIEEVKTNNLKGST